MGLAINDALQLMVNTFDCIQIPKSGGGIPSHTMRLCFIAATTAAP